MADNQAPQQEDLSWVPPELIEKLAEMGLLPDRLAQQQWIRARGQEAKDAPMPGGRVAVPGFRAANPMEVWAQVLKQQQGGQDVATSQRAIADAIRKYQMGSQDYLTGLQKSQQAKQQAQQQATMIPPVQPKMKDWFE